MVSDLPRSIVVGDFNGDGNLDLVVASKGSVSLLIGNGNGSFVSPTKLLENGMFIKVAVGDFNTDGKPDLAIARLDMPSISILINTGNGNFGIPINVATGNITLMTIGDFNADAKADIVTVSSQTNTGSVLLGNGSGGFIVMPTVFSVGNNPIGLAIGDFNTDGKSDLVIGGNDIGNGTGGTIITVFGNGSGGFSAPTTYDTGNFISSLAIGDFNVDGKPDLVTTNLVLNAVSTFIGNGNGSFGAKQDYRAGTYPIAVTVGDFNVDGKSDLVVGNISGLVGVSILLNCTVSSLVIAQPTYDCTTGQLSLSTTGSNGTTIEYRIAGLRDWAASNSFTVPAYQRNATSFTLEARQSGAIVSLPFVTACQSTTPSPPVNPPATTGLSLITPTYDCSTGQLALAITGGNGALVEYRVAGLRDWAASNSFTVPTYQRTGTSFTLEARQSGTVVSLPFTSACQSTTTTPPTATPLTVSAQALSCQTGALQLVSTGGDGTAIDFKVPGLRDYSASASFTVPTYQRQNTTFTLYARQSGKEVTAFFIAACPVGTRLASAETTGELEVVVYPNPVGEQFSVGVSGATGQAVRFHLTNLNGQTVLEQRAQVESDSHTETLRVPASNAGMYLLQVSTDTQSKTVKVLKP